MSSSRPERVGDQIRVEITELLAREVHDPGIGFLTVTRVTLTSDLQLARIYYTTLGDEKARRESARALERASPFLRRQIGKRVRLKRVPELQFFFDGSVERQDRIERIIMDLQEERATRPPIEDDAPPTEAAPADRVNNDDREDPQ
jgi:ribosome-binding factor A